LAKEYFDAIIESLASILPDIISPKLHAGGTMEEIQALLLGQIDSLDDGLKNQFIAITQKKCSEIERARSKKKQERLTRNLVSVYQEFGIQVKISD
tara:strand:+ start:161 stop:448 length:288 start_codon:yes stop_codon:yes gene_type:complete